MKKLLFLIFLVLVLVLGTIVATFVLRSTKEETLNGYIERLRAKGEKMTFEEMIASLSPQTNNSLAILTNIVQQLGPPPGDATNIEVMHFVGSGGAQIAWKLNQPTWIISAEDSRNFSWATVGDAIARKNALLVELNQAAEQPPRNAGFRTNFFERATPFREVKVATLWLVSEALWNLHEGKRRDVLNSIQAIASLTDLHREEYSLVSQMTRCAVAHFGLDLTWEALQTKEWNDEQLLILQKCWDGNNFLETAERGLEGERCMARESIKRGQQQKMLTANLSNSFYGTYILDNDLLFQIRFLQNFIEQVRTLRTNRAWREVSESLNQLNAELENLEKSPKRYLYLMTLLATPNFKRAVSTSVQRETQRRLTITVIALDRYKYKHGQFPSSLDMLVPEFLTSIPLDCMNGQPFRYRLNKDGTFTVYSVGEDGKDDGGDSTPVKSDGKPGLWEGRDAVWPTSQP